MAASKVDTALGAEWWESSIANQELARGGHHEVRDAAADGIPDFGHPKAGPANLDAIDLVQRSLLETAVTSSQLSCAPALLNSFCAMFTIHYKASITPGATGSLTEEWFVAIRLWHLQPYTRRRLWFPRAGAFGLRACCALSRGHG
jgi:hypothetical protein